MPRRNHPPVHRGPRSDNPVIRVAQRPYRVSAGDGGLRAPAVVMCDPKFVVNVASMVRNCACFGIDTLVITGNRVEIPTGTKRDRLPRQERMREYRTVELVRHDFPLALFPPDVVPICVELLPNAMPLPLVEEHPPNAVYILGPEDGSVPAGLRAVCHQFWRIPSLHCLNVAQAGGIVLYDRTVKRWHEGEQLELAESRGSEAVEWTCATY